MNTRTRSRRMMAMLFAAIAAGTMLSGCAAAASDPAVSTADDWMRAVLSGDEDKTDELAAGCDAFYINFSLGAGDRILSVLPDEVSWESELVEDGTTVWEENEWGEPLSAADAAKLEDTVPRAETVDYTINDDEHVHVRVVRVPAEDLICVHSAYEPL